jgi:thioredoxin 1
MCIRCIKDKTTDKVIDMAVIELNQNNFKKEVEQSQTPVIIDFYADWCGPCQMMKPHFEALSKEYDGKLKFAKLDTETNPQIAGNFDISGIPCLIVTKQGQEVDRIVGFAPAQVLKKKIDSIMQSI